MFQLAYARTFACAYAHFSMHAHASFPPTRARTCRCACLYTSSAQKHATQIQSWTAAACPRVGFCMSARSCLGHLEYCGLPFAFDPPGYSSNTACRRHLEDGLFVKLHAHVHTSLCTCLRTCPQTWLYASCRCTLATVCSWSRRTCLHTSHIFRRTHI